MNLLNTTLPSYEEIVNLSEYNYHYSEYFIDQQKYKSKLIEYLKWNWDKKTHYKKYSFIKKLLIKTEHFFCDPRITKTYSKIYRHTLFGDEKNIFCCNCHNKLVNYKLSYGY